MVREQTELLDQWGRLTKNSFEFLKELGDINNRLLERVSRQQLDLLTASLEATTRQAQLIAQPDYKALLDRQSSLIVDYNNKFVDIARESTNIWTEATDHLTDWVQRGVATVEKSAQSAARGFERAVQQGAELADEVAERTARGTEKAAKGAANGAERASASRKSA